MMIIDSILNLVIFSEFLKNLDYHESLVIFSEFLKNFKLAYVSRKPTTDTLQSGSTG
jgi:hypothetical protein